MEELERLERQLDWLERWRLVIAAGAGVAIAVCYVSSFVGDGTFLVNGVTAVFVIVTGLAWLAGAFLSAVWETRLDRLRRRPGVPDAWARIRRRRR
jgi:hypothetical protein